MFWIKQGISYRFLDAENDATSQFSPARQFSEIIEKICDIWNFFVKKVYVILEFWSEVMNVVSFIPYKMHFFFIAYFL